MTPSSARFGQVAGYRAARRSRGGGKGPDRGEALAAAIGEGDEVLQCPVQMPADAAVQVEGDGDESEQKGLRGCSATRPEAASPGRTSPVASKGACFNGAVWGSSRLPERDFPGPRRKCRPAFRGGFLLYG